MLEETNCDGIMIGRGALGNPWLVKEVEHYLEFNEYIEKPSKEEIINQAIEHLELFGKISKEGIERIIKEKIPNIKEVKLYEEII